MARILFLMMFPFVCFSQITPSEDIPVNNLLKEKENLDTKRKASYNLDEIKVRWKKAALENCPGVPCVVAPSFTCGTSTVSDVDGNSYETVAIGNQCWMKSNLRVMNYNNNDPIPDSTNSTWGTAIIGARTGYDVSVVPLNDYVGTFGYLYNWYAVNDPRKLCPDGWHVPTDSDWNKLVISWHSGTPVADTSSFSSLQSATAGTALKSQAINSSVGSGLGWNPGSPGTNTSGFTALPGGYRNFVGSFNNIRDNAFFWSATEIDNYGAWNRGLNGGNGNVYRSGILKTFGASVRCLRD
jgi:uncharacterized protein (TIGR02145 family)